MDFSDTVLLRESTKWRIVGAFLFIGAIFLISRSGSETTPAPDAHVSNNSPVNVSQQQKIPTTLGATQSAASETEKPLVCEGPNCPDCFQKIESGPNSNFAAFDPFLAAAADEAKLDDTTKANETAKQTDEAKELDQARTDLKAAIEENVDPLLRAKIKRDTTIAKKEKDVFESEQSGEKKNAKTLLTFVEKVLTDSDEWKKLTVDEKIVRYLKMKVTIEPSNLLIGELVEQIGNAVDVEVTVDKRALEEASYDTATQLSVKSKRPRPLKSVLIETLSNHGLSYIVKDEALLLTSEAKQRESMVTKLYPVGDLVTIPTTDDDEAAETDYESLINLLQTTVQPRTWKEVSGDDNGGTIDRYGITKVLVVRNIEVVHDELQELFTQLRTVKSPSARKQINVSELPLEQPDKIVRRIYFITDQQQIGRSGAGAGRRGPGAYGNVAHGCGGGSSGGLFAVSPEKISLALPKTLSLSSGNTIAAQLGSGGQTTQQPTPNPSTAGATGGLVATPSGQPAPNQAGNPGAPVPETQSDILTTAQMKARMESLVEIIPGTVDPAHWDKEKTSITNMENRLIIIQTVASQNEIEKLLRGLKVLSRVETW